MSSLVKAVVSNETARLANQLIYENRINMPFDYEITARFHRVKKTGDINIELLWHAPGFPTMYWLVVAIMEQDSNSNSFHIRFLRQYANEVRRFNATASQLPPGIRSVRVESGLKFNAVIALHHPIVISQACSKRDDFEVTFNGVHLEVLKGHIPGHFNVWLGDDHPEELAIGTIRTDLVRIDSVTFSTDETFELCHQMELLTVFKSVKGNHYETKEDLQSNAFRR